MGPRRGELVELRRLIDRYVSGAVADHVRTRLSGWNAPAAKLERKRRRASARLTLWIVLTLIAGFVAVFGLLGAAEVAAEQVLAGVVCATVTGALAVRSGMRLREIGRSQRQLGHASPASAVSGHDPLPPRGSLAREPMVRLADAERVLGELLRQAGAAGAASVPAESIEQARAAGTEAAAALRRVAAQLRAVEQARQHVPPGEYRALDDALERLRQQLDEGMDSYGALIAAAGKLVAASSTGGSDRHGLTEATDHLHALAVALRELFPDNA